MDVSDSVGWLLDQLGPKGMAVLLALAAYLLLKAVGKDGRRAAGRAMSAALGRMTNMVIRYVGVSLWAARMRMPIRLAYRLQPDRWREMCEARKLIGLKRGRIRRTPMGVDVRVTLGGALTLETLNARVKDLETGLGTRRGAIRIEGADKANKATVRITVRNPLARPVKWAEPSGPVSMTDAAPLSMNAFGEWTEIDLQQRILIVGASGSGKSSVQRVLSSPVILAADGELEVWDLKQGTESQHYEGKAAVRITTADEARKRLDWWMDVELPRRAEVMRRRGTSTWPTSPENPDRIVMVDEGAALIRELDEDELARFFTFLEQARAFGVYLWWATQFPKSSNLPTELRSQMSAVIALKMRRASESRVVFEDLAKEGWTPHRLPGKGWLLLLDDDHDEPEESRAAWITETEFRRLRATTAAAIEAAPAAPQLPPGAPPMPAVPPRIPAQEERDFELAPPEPVSLAKGEPESAADAGTSAAPELPVAEAVLAVLAEAGAEGSTPAQLQLATGRGKSQVYAALQQLQDDGQAVRVGKGRYALASTQAGEVSA